MIKTVLFDVDGVFLSEERCFDASALTVWELLYSAAYLGLSGESFTPVPDDVSIRRIRERVFANDQMLNFVKNRGINSNWDMVFLSTAHQLLHVLKELKREQPEFIREVLERPVGQKQLQQIGSAVRNSRIAFTPVYDAFVPDFSRSNAEKQALLTYLNDLAHEMLGVKSNIFSRNSELWELGRAVYQEWYLGDAYYEKSEGRSPQTEGKQGFLENEIALAGHDDIRTLLQDLRDKGLTLGIGTGRPQLETEVPFQTLGFLEYFHPNHIATASDVIQAEAAFPDRAPLGKPQPFTYIRALYGRELSDLAIVETKLPVENGREILIVGDSVADYMAARSMGCQFAATLTGLSGKDAREKFEQLQADYICDNVLELRNVLL